MKAIAQDEFGPPDVLQLREVEDPTVEAKQVLVRCERPPLIRGTGTSCRDFRTSRDRKQVTQTKERGAG
jgi:hypothetical protein